MHANIHAPPKAGKSGTLKSLHLFLREKYKDFAIRLNSDYPSFLTTDTAINDGNNVSYRLNLNIFSLSESAFV